MYQKYCWCRRGCFAAYGILPTKRRRLEPRSKDHRPGSSIPRRRKTVCVTGCQTWWPLTASQKWVCHPRRPDCRMHSGPAEPVNAVRLSRDLARPSGAEMAPNGSCRSRALAKSRSSHRGRIRTCAACWPSITPVLTSSTERVDERTRDKTLPSGRFRQLLEETCLYS